MTNMKQLEKESKAEDTALSKRLLICWVVASMTLFICDIFRAGSAWISGHVGDLIPSVGKLLKSQLSNEVFAGQYFGVATLLLPLMAVYMVCGFNALERFRYTQAHSDRSVAERLIVGYLLGLPVLAFILYSFWAAPFDMPESPHLSGQYVLDWMTRTYLGLLVFGPALITALALAIGVLLLVTALPFVTIYSKPKGVN